MTTVSVDEFRAQVDRYLAAAANGEVVLTRDGKPWLVLRTVEQELDSAGSPEFWRMIRQRRQEQGILWEEARKQLDLD